MISAMRHALLRFVASACLAGAACTPAAQGPRPLPPAAATDEARHTIYLVSHGWHTGLVLPVRGLEPAQLPWRAEFPEAAYLEIGWGERDFYQAERPGLVTALKAALLPTPAVLHVVALDRPVEEYFPASDIVPLAVTGEGLEGLLAYLRASAEYDAAGALIPLGAGLYGRSRFYAARERFHLFRTCNVWTAHALRAAGIPVADSLTARGLMAQAEAHGQRLCGGAGETRLTAPNPP
jgi:uncharacterized protein (TIGR02117 family)